MDLFDAVKTARKLTDSVLVGVSGGKDSVATLDVCTKFFPRVQPFFMYIVEGLSFQESFLRYIEKRYKLKVLRVPHFMLSDFMRDGSFRMPDGFVPRLKIADIYNYLRDETGIYWIAGGERIADSTIRRAMIKQTGSIDKKRGRIYPLAYWNKAQVLSYIRMNRLYISEESKVLGFSFRGLRGNEIIKVKEKFPADFEKIKEIFPLIEASITRENMKNGRA